MPLIALIFSLLATITPSVLAATPTPTAAATAEPTSTNLEEIQRIRQAVQQKVKEKIREIASTEDTKKAIVGDVVQVNANNITISFEDKQRQLIVNDDTVYINEKRVKTTLDKIKVGQGILAMGYLNADGVLDTRRIVFLNLADVTNQQSTVVAKIADISTSSSVLLLIPVKDKDQQYQVKIDTKTSVTTKKKDKLTTDDLYTSQKIVAILEPDPKITKTYYAPDIVALENNPPEASPTPAE